MTSSHGEVKTLIGGATSILATKPDPSSDTVPALLDLLKKHHVKYIDSAIIYGNSEESLGVFHAGEKGFIIDTKIPGGFRPESLKEDELVKLGHESIQKLGIKKINTLYMHSPSTGSDVPISETLSGINTLYKEGLFESFGLSNYTPQQVQETYDHCKTNGYVLPSVYQGSYHAFGRHYDTTLFPLLRKLGMSFYAYSPAAGGFLSKTAEDLVVKGGRFDKSSGSSVAGMYNEMYSDKPAMMEGHSRWIAIAEDAGIKPAGMALRWVKYNSVLSGEHGDGIIVGGRTLEQIEDSLKLLEDGPLPADVAAKIDQLWDLVKSDADTDNYHDYILKKRA